MLFTLRKHCWKQPFQHSECNFATILQKVATDEWRPEPNMKPHDLHSHLKQAAKTVTLVHAVGVTTSAVDQMS